MAEFKSTFGIGDKVSIIPMHQKAKCIRDINVGTIVAVRFTETKLFYDILSHELAEILDNIDADAVFRIERQ